MQSQNLTYQAPEDLQGETQTQESTGENVAPGEDPQDGNGQGPEADPQDGAPSDVHPGASDGGSQDHTEQTGSTGTGTKQQELVGTDAVIKLLSYNKSRLWAGAILLLIVGICGITVLTRKPQEE